MRRLAAVDAGAAALGLFVGQKATDAAALVPELATAEAEPALRPAALVALADWCARFSPAVASDAPDGLFLDITGVAHLWGGEAAMMADLIARLAERPSRPRRHRRHTGRRLGPGALGADGPSPPPGRGGSLWRPCRSRRCAWRRRPRPRSPVWA